MSIRPAGLAGLFTDGSWLYTRNLVPGRAVYGEGLVSERGVEYRRWDANRSKLAAYVKKGGRSWPFAPASTILYLGAGSGTTVSHLSDLCPRGTILAVEISPRVFRDLMRVAESRPNLLPVLGDAANPESYRAHVASPRVLYQDVAQRDQEGIFSKNLSLLGPGGVGILMVKARSVDVAANPASVVRSIRRGLDRRGLTVLDARSLEPFQADHAAIVVEKR